MSLIWCWTSVSDSTSQERPHGNHHVTRSSTVSEKAVGTLQGSQSAHICSVLDSLLHHTHLLPRNSCWCWRHSGERGRWTKLFPRSLRSTGRKWTPKMKTWNGVKTPPPIVYRDPPDRRGILCASYGRNRGLTFGNVIYAMFVNECMFPPFACTDINTCSRLVQVLGLPQIWDKQAQ